MICQVHNSRVVLFHTDPFLLAMLDTELRYQTPVGKLLEGGVVLPEGALDGWDGWVRLLHVPKQSPPWVPVGLLDRVVELSRKFGYEVWVEDKRERPVGDVPEPVKIPLRDYQQEAVDRALDRGMGVLDLVPRSGKTRILVEITRCLALPVLWIAPTDRIVTQTHEVLEGFLGKNYSMHLVGSGNWEMAKSKRVVVCTAATAMQLSQAFYDSRKVIVVDEFHHSGAASYRKIFAHCDHIYHRYGMTGTYFRSTDDELAMHALLSGTIYRATSADMLQRGWLVPVRAVFIPIIPHRIGGGAKNFFGDHGKRGIHENALRNQMVTYAARVLFERGRRVLILVGTKPQGHALQKMLVDMLPRAPERAEFSTVEFLSTDMPRDRQNRVMRSFNQEEEVKMLIGTSLLGEGVDLPMVDALVYAKGEKAEVSLTQAMYRICTAVEGKSEAILVDFADRHHRKLLSHALERLKIYHSEPIFQVEVLPDIQAFIFWVDSLRGIR